MKNDIQVGQLCELAYRENDKVWWEYVVATKVFDDRVDFKKECGGSYMHVFETEKSDNEDYFLKGQKQEKMLHRLFKGGKPVLSKKNILGRYTFKPKG